MDNRGLTEADQELMDLIMTVRKKPEMYLGEKSIRRFRGFIDGYESGMGYCGKMWRNGSSMYGFDIWVDEKLRFPEPTSGWVTMIEHGAGGDAAGLDMFFELIDEFRAGHK